MTVLVVLACLIVSVAAVVAALGFVHPVLDLFNHLQPALFFGALTLFVLSIFLTSAYRPRAFALSLAATGFVASGFVYVPEAVLGIQAALNREAGVAEYRMVSFNVFGRNEVPDVLAGYLIETDADIVALQEYSQEVRRAIHDRLAEHYPHFQYCAGGQRAFVGLYAKIPFEPLDVDMCSASIANQDRTARIVVRFDPPEGSSFALATTHNDWPAPVTRQVEQFDTLHDALALVEPPVILAGDFNSTPWSYTLRRFVSDAGLTRHTFNLPTFPTLWYYLGDWRPTPAILPIDHIMTRGDITVHSITRGEPAGSDHLPLIVAFSVEH